MTEQPDTTTIRADYAHRDGDDLDTAARTIKILCDALDDARAERDCQSAFCAGGYEAARIATARAEAAEAERDIHKDRYRAAQIVYVAEHERAEAAEARAEDWKERHHRERERAQAAEAMRDTHAADVTDLANKHARALDRAEAAEARIAAALLVCCNYEWCGDGMECEVRRALTEGTGQ